MFLAVLLSAGVLGFEEVLRAESAESCCVAETGAGLRAFRGAGRLWEEMSKSSLNLDMQRYHARSETSAFAKTATSLQGVAQASVLRVVQRNEPSFAVSARTQALRVESGAGLVEVELRPLAAVRARDDAEVARVEETCA